MSEFWQSFTPGFSGWQFMWILLLSAAFVIAVAVERFRYIFQKANISAPHFMLQIRRLVDEKDYKQAISLCRRLQDKALPCVVLMVVAKAAKNPGATFRSLQNAADEATLEVIPKLQARINYLAMMGNISTLIGLMGTIYGLIISFRSLSAPGIDAAEKSRLLAHGIAVAMNTTLFGLAIAIPAIMAYTIINNKTNRIMDEIDEHTVKLINLIAEEE
jgi:biopolymer transport protein ExbB